MAPSTPTGSPPSPAVPDEVYTGQQLMDIATTVVRSRSLQGIVMDNPVTP